MLGGRQKERVKKSEYHNGSHYSSFKESNRHVILLAKDEVALVQAQWNNDNKMPMAGSHTMKISRISLYI